MNLNNFESYIDRTIFLRGYDYYEDGNVNFVKETEANVYIAEVFGAEMYTIDVKLDDSLDILETFCDCPYDMGEFCKHQVAVFLTLKDIKNSKSEEKNSKAKLFSNKEEEPDINQILSKRTKEELIEFLIEIAAENEEVNQRLLLEFDGGDDEEEILKAVSLIHTYIDNNSDHNGFVNYMDVNDAVYGAMLVYEKAETAIDEGNVVQAVNLALCLVREMVDLIQYADDSSGTICEVIDHGLSLIEEVIEVTEISPSEKRTIFESLIKEASHSRYDDWTDWRLYYFESASNLSDIPELRNELEDKMSIFLKNKDNDTWSSNYYTEKVNLIRYNMILRNDGEQKALEFIDQNLEFSSFRKMTIDRAMQNKDYEQVIKLALESEAKDIKLRGLVREWKEYRYKAYKLLGKMDELQRLAMDFIMNGSFEHYKELKNTYSIEEWVGIYPKMILDLGKQNKSYSNIYTKILIAEGDKEKLLEYVKENPSSVECYYEHLVPEFKKEVYEVFIKYIEQTASRARNRRNYQEVCAIIRNLKKAGGKEQALAIKQKLYSQYANRPAFRDELTNLSY